MNSNDIYNSYDNKNLKVNYQHYEEDKKPFISYQTQPITKQPTVIFQEYQEEANYQNNQEDRAQTKDYYSTTETQNNMYYQSKSPKNKHFNETPSQTQTVTYQKNPDIKNLEEEIKNIVIDIDPQTNNYSSSSNLNKNLYHQANKITTTITRKKLYNDSNNEQKTSNQPIIDQLPNLETNDIELIENTSDEYKESTPVPEEKKTPQRKYKVTTVPLEKSRVKVNHEKKLSNIGPITVIQQGTFSLLSARERANISKITKRERSRSQKPVKRKSNNYNTHNLEKPKSNQKEFNPRNRYHSELNIDLNYEKRNSMVLDRQPQSERTSRLENVRNKFTLKEYLNHVKLNDKGYNS
jgi:hypothetical protein